MQPGRAVDWMLTTLKLSQGMSVVLLFDLSRDGIVGVSVGFRFFKSWRRVRASKTAWYKVMLDKSLEANIVLGELDILP